MSTPAPQLPHVTTQQSSLTLRDHLNTRIAPFLKKAIKQSLVDEPEFPLRYVGEYLINQSLQFEQNPQQTDIKNYFQYSFEKERVQVQPTENEMVNGSTSETEGVGELRESEVNGTTTTQQQEEREGEGEGEGGVLLPPASAPDHAPEQDTDMAGTS